MRRPVPFPELTFGYVRPRVSAAATVDRLLCPIEDGTRTPHRAADVIRRNRVVLLAHRALTPFADRPSAGRLLAELAPLAEQRHQRHAGVTRSTELLDDLARRTGIGVWGIKGLASRAGYPEPSLRELRDVDVAVAGQDEAFHLARLLRSNGFSTDPAELPWVKADRHGTPYGQYKLNGPPGLAAVDLHFGPGYSTGHCGLLAVPRPDFAGFRPLPQVANLRPMLGNSGGDVHITAKDVNDLWVAASALTDDEVSRLVADAGPAGLAGQLADIAELVLAVMAVDEHRRAVLERLAAAGGRRPRPVLATGRMRRTDPTRIARTVRRAYHQAKAHTSAPLGPLAVAIGAFAYYSAPLRLRVHPFPAVRQRPRPWRCVRLVPATLAAAARDGGPSAAHRWQGDATEHPVPAAGPDGLRFVPAGTGHVAVCGDTSFVPTVWYLVSRRAIGHAETRLVPESAGT
jgi:hypothetical protein